MGDYAERDLSTGESVGLTYTPSQLDRAGSERTCESCGEESVHVYPRYVDPCGKGCYRGRHCRDCWEKAQAAREENDG